MKRRKFIKSIFWGFLIISSSPFISAFSGLKKNKKLSGEKTVLVIGAGISGLATAKKLKENGFRVIVLEAQERIGGRLKTNRSFGFPFEEGAAWIHGFEGNPLKKFALASGLSLTATDDENVEVFDLDGKVYPEEVFNIAEKQFEQSLAAVEKSGKENLSFSQVFSSLYPGRLKERIWHYFLSAYLEFNTGGDISELSSVYFADDELFAGEDLLVTNGYDRLINYLAKNLTIHLSAKVKTIDYSGDKIFVTTNEERFSADYVVISVPLGVLKNGDISFNPPLPPEKIKSINQLKMGNVNKFLLVWDEPFWNPETQYIGYTAETKGKFNYFLNLKKTNKLNALLTFAFGQSADLTEKMSDSQIINEIMNNLKNIYGNQIPEPRLFFRTKWRNNLYSYGAYSFVPKGCSSQEFLQISLPLDDKLFFAGEHTEKKYRGTVHGAYLSGSREAERILAKQKNIDLSFFF